MLTYEELCAELEAEAADLDPEQWIGGVVDVGEYVIEACLVGIYDTVEVVAALVNRDTETVVEYTRDGDEVVAQRAVADD